MDPSYTRHFTKVGERPGLCRSPFLTASEDRLRKEFYGSVPKDRAGFNADRVIDVNKHSYLQNNPCNYR